MSRARAVGTQLGADANVVGELKLMLSESRITPLQAKMNLMVVLPILHLEAT